MKNSQKQLWNSFHLCFLPRNLAESEPSQIGQAVHIPTHYSYLFLLSPAIFAISLSTAPSCVIQLSPSPLMACSQCHQIPHWCWPGIDVASASTSQNYIAVSPGYAILNPGSRIVLCITFGHFRIPLQKYSVSLLRFSQCTSTSHFNFIYHILESKHGLLAMAIFLVSVFISCCWNYFVSIEFPLRSWVFSVNSSST